MTMFGRLQAVKKCKWKPYRDDNAEVFRWLVFDNVDVIVTKQYSS